MYITKQVNSNLIFFSSLKHFINLNASRIIIIYISLLYFLYNYDLKRH